MKLRLPESSREILVKVKGLCLRYSSGKNWLGRERQWVDGIQGYPTLTFTREKRWVLLASRDPVKQLWAGLCSGLNKPVQGSIWYSGGELLAMPNKELHHFQATIFRLYFRIPIPP